MDDSGKDQQKSVLQTTIFIAVDQYKFRNDNKFVLNVGMCLFYIFFFYFTAGGLFSWYYLALFLLLHSVGYRATGLVASYLLDILRYLSVDVLTQGVQI